MEDPNSKAGTSANAKSKAGGRSNHLSKKRVSQACDRCRQRKDKCDGRRPACSACVHRRLTCSYDPSIKKRGLPEGYVRDLELHSQALEAYVLELEIAWALVIGIDGSIADKIFADVREGDATNIALPKILKDDAALSNLRGVWRESSAFRTLRKRHSVIETLDEKYGNRRYNFEEVQGAVPNDSDNESLGATLEGLGREVSTNVEYDAQKCKSECSTIPSIDINFLSPIRNPRSAVGQLKVPPRAWRLMEIYFTHTHTWLPIVEKHQLLRTLHQYSSEKSTSLPNTGSHAVLWAALAFADIQYWSIDNPPASEPGLSTDDLYRHARRLIPDEDGDFEIGHIQALLILSLFNMGCNKDQAAWMLVGQAVRIALHLELNKSIHKGIQQGSSSSTSRNRHVLLGCFTVDTLLSSRLRRIPHLGMRDLALIGTKVQEDGLEEWDPWVDCLSTRKQKSQTFRGPPLVLSTFNRFVQVLWTMNEATIELPTNENVHGQESRLINLHHARINHLINLPELSLDTVHDASLLPHHFNLHIAHLALLASLRIRQYRSSVESDDKQDTLDKLSRVIQESSRLVQKYSDTFGIFIAPPTFEYFLSTIYEGHEIVRTKYLNSHVLDAQWRSNLERLVGQLHRVWPVFTNLHQSLSNSITAHLATDIVNQSGLSNVESNVLPVRFYSDDGVYETDQSHNTFVGGLLATNDELQALTAFDIFPAAGQPDGTPHGLGTTSSVIEDSTLGRESSLPKKLYQPSLLNTHSKMDMTFDQDNIFNEFSMVDAMEWTGIYDQSLLNLGFSNVETMNQEFSELYEDNKSP